MTLSRRALGLTIAAVLVVLFAWAAAGIVGLAPVPGGHEGDQLDALDGLATDVEAADEQQVESTPFRRDVVTSLHRHTNAVIWGGAAPDLERFAQIVTELDDRGAHDLAQRLDDAMQLVDAGRAYAAHDLLVELEGDLGPTPR